VIVQAGTRMLPRPEGALVFADQEGGLVKTFPSLPPWRAAASFGTAAEAYAAGRATGASLRRAGVDVDLAPVLDRPDGPLGSRQFRNPLLGVAFARGLAAAGIGACAKHFPGLGSASISTDERPHVHAIVRAADLAPFRAAVRARVPCVMANHAFYERFGRFRASLEPGTYRLLRSFGFRGVAITDSLSLSIVAHPPRDWPVAAARAGADLLLFTDPKDARAAIDELLPLARSGELDAHVARVLRFRARYG
jgi:beta-N-acetylhexosaminidase